VKKAHFYSPICPLLLIFFLTISCKGQNIADKQTRSTNTRDQALIIGDTVSEIADQKLNLVFQDTKENFWFTGGDGGIYKYDGKNLVLFTLKDGLCSLDILGIQEDNFGNLYFDTPKGVSKFDGQKFSTLEIITGDSSKNEWKLGPDDLWFRMGWDQNGPYRYDGKALYQLEFPRTFQEDEFYSKYPNASYNPYGIYKIYKDSKGNIWFGTSSLGLCRYDGNSVSWLYEKQLTDTPEGGSFGIRSIIEDRDGKFWFCNSHYRYAISPDSIVKKGTNSISYKRENGIGYSNEKGETEYPYFMSMEEDNDGDLWMASYDSGVWRKRGEELIHYPIKDGDTDVLLFSIYKDKKGIIWLGSHNAGAYKFNGSDFEKFNPIKQY